jgi:hypothetical protein
MNVEYITWYANELGLSYDMSHISSFLAAYGTAGKACAHDFADWLQGNFAL